MNKYHEYRNILIQFTILIVFLMVGGFLMQYKVGNMLNAALEQTIARQTADIAVIAEERFNKELSQLRFAAQYISKHPGTEADILNELRLSGKKAETGLVTIQGETIQGIPLYKEEFNRLPRAYRGNEIIDYCIGNGLLFAVPVMNGDRVRAVLYKLYDDRVLTDLFGLNDYDYDRKLLIQERNGQIIVPYDDYGEMDKEFFMDPTILDGFQKVKEKLKSSRAAAVYYEGPRGEFFLFGADLPQTNCSLIGYVSWSAVAGTISRANIMIFIVHSALLILFLIAGVYLFLLNEKAKRAEKLSREKAQADQANQAKSAFLANMSHEIRTPINAVIGMNEMILRECNDPNIIKYANNAHSASESLLSLINDILDFSKIESGKMELIEETYQLDELIKNLINMIKTRAEKKELEFIVKVNENIPNELFGDSVRIRQVVVNFLTNAVKYTQVGSVEFSVDFDNYTPPNLDVELPEDDKLILLMFSVKDTGIGIKEEDKAKLFEDFQRVDNKKNKNIEGTGLGLAITNKLVKMMHGHILIESKYGEGSTFTAIFPQKVIGTELVGKFEERSKTTKAKHEKYKVSFIAPDAKVLVVDDNEMNLLVATSLLKATKVQVDTAISGMEALKKLAETQYDLIFLDQMMPSLDGIQTLKLAKEMKNNKSAEAPVIALTANAISGAREMFLSEGFNDYLSKPIDSAALEKMMMEYLPVEKLHSPSQEEIENTKESTESIEQTKTAEATASTETNKKYKYLNVELGLQYSADMEDMYKEILTMFCDMKKEKQSKINEAFESGNWNNYTTFVHALKSTALSVGGEECSEASKKLEMSGKILISSSSSELDKHEAEEYIKTHTAEAMELYDKLVDEGRDYLNAELRMQNAELESDKASLDSELRIPNSELDASDELSDLQEAFDNEDWLMYSILVDQLDNVDKNFKMACQMITSEFTNDQEKQEAIQYIKDNHYKISGDKDEK